MAHSRFSIPLFAMGLLALAAVMTYLVMTKNIFGLGSFNNTALEQPLSIERSEHEVASGETSTTSYFDVKKIKAAIASGAKKITGTQVAESTEGSVGVAASGGQAAVVVEAPHAAGDSNSNIILSYAQSAASQSDNSSKSLWRKYSATIPPLYSHPRDANTEAILGRVGQLSMQLDLQAYDVQSEFELIKIAVAGEREGARALSFQHMNPSRLNTTQALTWALIANAIAPNDYYLYICSRDFQSCTDAVFSQAAMQAKYAIDEHGFSQIQGEPSKSK